MIEVTGTAVSFVLQKACSSFRKLFGPLQPDQPSFGREVTAMHKLFPSSYGMPCAMAKSSAARSTPVWPQEMRVRGMGRVVTFTAAIELKTLATYLRRRKIRNAAPPRMPIVMVEGSGRGPMV